MKRCLDLVVSTILLIVCLPFILIICLFIRLLLGSPIFFTQQRPGLHGKPFLIYKFRTMTDQRDKHGVLLPDEVRLTPFGQFLRRYSLDELPQLLNVLKGELSLVGPRPLLMEYLPLYDAEQARRHEVKPGMTGWAQVHGRNALSWEEKFALDVWYVDHQSFGLDLRILWLTVYTVFSRLKTKEHAEIIVADFTGSRPHTTRGDVIQEDCSRG